MHNWSIETDGYKLFRRDRQGRRGEDIAFCVKEWIDCTELSLNISNELVESLRAKIRGKPTKETLWLLFTTGHSIKGRTLTQCSIAGCITFAGSDPSRGLQSSSCLLEKGHSKL